MGLLYRITNAITKFKYKRDEIALFLDQGYVGDELRFDEKARASTGLSINWYPDGSKKIQGEFSNGTPNGLYTEWYNNGKKAVVGVFKNGVENGESTRWYKNGKKKQEGSFSNGKKDGIWTWWYNNGIKKKEGEYINGKFNLKQKWPNTKPS